MQSFPKWLIVVIVIIVIICCCITPLGLGVVGYSYLQQATLGPWEGPIFDSSTPTSTPEFKPKATNTPTPEQNSEVTPEATLDVTQETNSGSEETLHILENAIVPNIDLRDLATRLKGIQNIPETVLDPDAPYEIGAKKNFWVLNNDTHESEQITATLRYKTDHMYFWAENGADYNDSDMRDLIDEFETKIYPTDRNFFGSEWTPGIDNDPHIYLVYAEKLGSNIAGYFSSADEVPPQAHQYSNAHEAFMVATSQDLGYVYTYGVLAHEFQHMIHWYQDKNEESWLNEGLAELAVYLNGYGAGDKAFLYAYEPDTMLTDWPTDPNTRDVHYGVSFMFVKYFLDRFGEQATQAVVASQKNGLESMDEVLKTLDIRDPLTGDLIQANDVFADWAAANFIQDPDVGDGRYAYKDYSDVPKFEATDQLKSCDGNWNNYSVNQYGVDYIQITCRGKFSFNFEGLTEVGVLPEDPYQGIRAFWSNKGDESDMTLTQQFDFTSVTGPLEISYWTWYDLEEDYDYVYLLASEDGESWEILKTPHCTTDNPSGNSYGCGYNAQSNGWIEETVDLSKFAGKKVFLRFEYVTDTAVTAEGFMLDEIKIPAINYSTDFEKDNGGWIPAGFVRIDNQLPQTYSVSIIHLGDQVKVERLELNPDQVTIVDLNLSDDAIIVVGGTTRFTRQQAVYRIKLDSK
jgi:immune inhibitor A